MTRHGTAAATTGSPARWRRSGCEVLARLELRGDETVLDAGCGSGRITEALIERLPRGRVIAVDASASMVDGRARAAAASADVRVVDLLELELERAGRRDPLDRDLPLDRRPRAAVRAAARARCARRAARRAVRRRGQHRRAARRTPARCSRASPTPRTSPAGAAVELRRRRSRPRERLLAAGFTERRLLAAAGAPAARAPARVPLDDRARPARASSCRARAARAVHGRRARRRSASRSSSTTCA